MMEKMLLGLLALALLSASALAQQPMQPLCKSYYVIGEVVPAHCSQQTINSSNCTTWGGGRDAKSPAPTLFDFSYGGAVPA